MDRIETPENAVLIGDFNLGIVPLAGNHKYKIVPSENYPEYENLLKCFNKIDFDELTYEVGNPIGSIDKVMYSGNLKLISIEKLNEEISDHYPIMVKFEI